MASENSRIYSLKFFLIYNDFNCLKNWVISTVYKDGANREERNLQISYE